MMQEAVQPLGPAIRNPEPKKECLFVKFERVDHSPAPSTPVHLTNLWFGGRLAYRFSRGWVWGQVSEWVEVDLPTTPPSWVSADANHPMHERSPDGFLTTRALIARYDAEKKAHNPASRIK